VISYRSKWPAGWKSEWFYVKVDEDEDKLVQSPLEPLQNNHPFSNAYMCCKKFIYALLRSIPTHNYVLPILPLLGSITTLVHALVKPSVMCCHGTTDI
jgi:hypothetical protein